MESGIYFLDQLSIILEPRLGLLASIPHGLMFALKNVNSTAQLELPNNKCLFAGIEEMSTLCIQYGTKLKKVFIYFFIFLSYNYNIIYYN